MTLALHTLRDFMLAASQIARALKACQPGRS
jgi:hypothetical protein